MNGEITTESSLVKLDYVSWNLVIFPVVETTKVMPGQISR